MITRTVTQFTALLERIPHSFVRLVIRVAVFVIFWRAGSVKLDDWAGTVSLFESEYQVPLLSPELAAMLGTAVELGGSALVLLGLGTRFAALALLGLVAVIQFAVYPMDWPHHLPWAAMLLVLVSRGPGKVSLDHLIARRFAPGP